MNGSLRTVDHADADSQGLTERWRRDSALARRILGMLWFYFTAGRRVRKAYGDCEREGRVYWVDGVGGEDR
ncbi:MAG: hypothetical protein OXG29_04915 [Gammaproteobacteria bacterium]|nr:hypothetical protein [Gammaproteobacteria bacterium]MCY3989457.1 hypothetical protein [Gammaproteobacteria bacterium]